MTPDQCRGTYCVGRRQNAKVPVPLGGAYLCHQDQTSCQKDVRDWMMANLSLSNALMIDSYLWIDLHEGYHTSAAGPVSTNATSGIVRMANKTRQGSVHAVHM
jgi:hypothetical protein